jgi:hypothetical protein
LAGVNINKLSSEIMPRTKIKELTIEKELRERKIADEFFYPFLEELVVKKEIPYKDIVPRTQYNRILGYLQDEGVISPEGRVNLKSLRLISHRILIKDILEREPYPMPSYPGMIESTGGLNPCYRDRHNTGGLNPCY